MLTFSQKILTCFLLCLSTMTFAAEKPNIILVLVDDLGFGDLSCFGQTKFTTPNIDRLAASGMKFNQHYAGSTVCGPSRASLLSGLHTGHGFIRGNAKVSFPYDPEMPLVSYHLKQLGYKTAMIGKSGVTVGSEDPLLPNKKSFDHFFGYLTHRGAHRHYPKHLYRNGETITYENNTGKKGDVYAEDVVHDDVLRFVEENKDTPFFLHWASAIPHADLTAPQEEIDQWVGKLGEDKAYKGSHYASQKYPKATHVAMITRFDRQMGQLLDKLKELKIDKKTFIFFSSDNGPHKEGGMNPRKLGSNGQFRGGKRDLFEGGIRVPTIVSWPGKIEAGTESDHVSAFWDFPATAVHLAGGQVNFKTDGISYLPEMLGQRQKKHDVLYWEFHEQGGKQAIVFGDGRWKAVRLGVGKNKNAKVKLYDLKTDIGEKTDVSKKYPELVSEAKKLFRTERTKSKIFKFKWEK